MLSYKIQVQYDERVDVWFVAKSNVPGLSYEASTPTEMKKALLTLVPELLYANGTAINFEKISLRVLYRHCEIIELNVTE